MWAITMMRDEQDVAWQVLAHMAEEWVDGIIVADNGSTDGTHDLIMQAKSELSVPMVVLDDPEVGYYQSRKMTELARLAAESYGAHWIVPFDADELWFSHLNRLGLVLREQEEIDVVEVEMFDHVPTWIDETTGTAFSSMVYRKTERNDFRKVAFRWQPGAEIKQGNHGVYLPSPRRAPETEEALGLEIRHFPYRSAEQFRRKAINGAEAYAATDLDVSIGAHWRQYGEIYRRHGAEGITAVFERYHASISPTDDGLVHDPAPFLRWSRGGA